LRRVSNSVSMCAPIARRKRCTRSAPNSSPARLICLSSSLLVCSNNSVQACLVLGSKIASPNAGMRTILSVISAPRGNNIFPICALSISVEHAQACDQLIVIVGPETVDGPSLIGARRISRRAEHRFRPSVVRNHASPAARWPRSSATKITLASQDPSSPK
jgi:hypothetical protein